MNDLKGLVTRNFQPRFAGLMRKKSNEATGSTCRIAAGQDTCRRGGNGRRHHVYCGGGRQRGKTFSLTPGVNPGTGKEREDCQGQSVGLDSNIGKEKFVQI